MKGEIHHRSHTQRERRERDHRGFHNSVLALCPLSAVVVNLNAADNRCDPLPHLRSCISLKIEANIYRAKNFKLGRCSTFPKNRLKDRRFRTYALSLKMKRLSRHAQLSMNVELRAIFTSAG